MMHEHTLHDADLTAIGLSSNEIRTLYYTKEPMMQDIIDSTSQLSEGKRRLALALIHTLAVLDNECNS